MLGLQSATLMFMISMVTIGVMVFAKDPEVVHAYVATSAITDFRIGQASRMFWAGRE
jgi:hypothetical protein